MGVLGVAVILCLVATASAELGVSGEHGWAYQWYEGEEFSFRYIHPGRNASDPDLIVIWETPGGSNLTSTSLGADDPNFAVRDIEGIKDGELNFKRISEDLHGVYICHVYEYDSRVLVNRTIFGLNIREPRYRDMIDKYRRNIIVAFVSTAVFLVPLLAIILTYQFSYERVHGDKSKNGGTRAYLYGANDFQMSKTEPRDFTEPVKSPEGKGAYENVDLSTNL